MRKAKVGLLSLVLAAVSIVSGAQGTQNPSTEALLSMLYSSNSALDAKRSMKALSMRRESGAVEGIMDNLSSPYLDVRVTALRALIRYHDPADLELLESIILDPQSQYTVAERITAIKGYVTIEGWDQEVLEDALAVAVNPIEAEVLRRGINGESFSMFSMGGG